MAPIIIDYKLQSKKYPCSRLRKKVVQNVKFWSKIKKYDLICLPNKIQKRSSQYKTVSIGAWQHANKSHNQMLVHSNCSVSKHANKTTRTANQNQPRRSKTVVMALLLLKPNLHKKQQTIWYLLNTQQHWKCWWHTHARTPGHLSHTRGILAICFSFFPVSFCSMAAVAVVFVGLVQQNSYITLMMALPTSPRQHGGLWWGQSLRNYLSNFSFFFVGKLKF